LSESYNPQILRLRRLVAWSAIFLMLVLGSIESAHAHSPASQATARTLCIVCVLGHSTVPSVRIHLVSSLMASERHAPMVRPVCYREAHRRLHFIRPPPTA
jgi:hypothetical protein